MKVSQRLVLTLHQTAPTLTTLTLQPRVSYTCMTRPAAHPEVLWLPRLLVAPCLTTPALSHTHSCIPQSRHILAGPLWCSRIAKIPDITQSFCRDEPASSVQVVESLRPHGLTLQNFASIREQAIGGFIQVGAHGTGASIPPVDQQVVAMKLVTPALGTLELSEVRLSFRASPILPCMTEACHSCLGTSQLSEVRALQFQSQPAILRGTKTDRTGGRTCLCHQLRKQRAGLQ